MRDLRQMWRFGWWARLDSLAHFLGVPGFLQRGLCDRFERSLDKCYWIPPSQNTSTTTANGTNVTWTWTYKGNG